MKVKLNKRILCILLIIFLIAVVLLLVQCSGFDKESVEEINTTDISVSAGRTVYMSTGETKTVEYAFWVRSKRWVKEDVNWEVCEISFDPGIVVSCSPSSGIIHRGDPPADVSLVVTAYTEGKYKGRIIVQRVDDPYDKDIIYITIHVLAGG